ncbi:MAG: MCP four helix bundle domain-containing protein [Lewinellaceae bacterium]|nr:MCP four helix bundle domain-containing protein [Saprospiraceae bacterium]MCB9333465.1 MCP four helix bundle domain-containing protein [Lewinellaceae bacterium]
MKWAFSIQQKFKAAALLAIVCVIILITNLLGRQHIDTLGSAFSSVYEDRLVVESYIYKLSNHLYQKKLMLDNCAGQSDAQRSTHFGTHDTAISDLLVDYEKTRLTEEEVVCFRDFKANVAALQNLEHQYFRNAADGPQRAETRSQIEAQFATASSNLHQLSLIQLKEGKQLTDQSQRIVAGSSLLTSFEMAVLIAIAIILQVLVLASKPVVSRITQRSSLN